MIRFNVRHADNSLHPIEVEENPSSNLMELLVEHDYEIAAICGGIAGCGTCHIELLKGQEQLDPVEPEEEFLLDTLPNLTPRSRLSCQLPLRRNLDGVEFRVLGDGV